MIAREMHPTTAELRSLRHGKDSLECTTIGNIRGPKVDFDMFTITAWHSTGALGSHGSQCSIMVITEVLQTCGIASSILEH